MYKTTISLVVAGALLAACGSTTPPPSASQDPITAAISGKMLKSANSELRLFESKRLTGKAGPDGDVDIEGAWEIREGQFCRTINLPAQLAGTQCQDATMNADGTITIAGIDGPVTYLVEDQ